MSQERPVEERDTLPIAVLKVASHEKHQRLEAAFPWARAFSSRENYGRLLSALASLVRPADRAIDTALGNDESFPYAGRRRRAEWIERDLQRLGLPGCGLHPPPADFSFIDTRAGAVGALYVLEGSALGAQLLSRELENRLGVTPEAGGSYLHAYGAKTAESWREFQSWVNQELSTPDLLDSAVSASLLTFDRFSQHLTDLFDAR